MSKQEKEEKRLLGLSVVASLSRRVFESFLKSSDARTMRRIRLYKRGFLIDQVSQ